MTKGRDRVTKRRAPEGISLAFLALLVQALLPFFFAVEIATYSDPAAAEITSICSHGSEHHESGTDPANHSACPLCIALSAAQPFTAATPALLPLPQAKAGVALPAPAARGVIANAAAPYQSRGPPVIG